jgi:peptidyl-prolyl cis-trans isomerase SurA
MPAGQLQLGAICRLAEFSQDEGAFKGGDWGWMRLDQMDPEVANGIASIPSGEIVGPVRSTGGYYIAVARETRRAGVGEESSGIVNLRQVLWSLPGNAADSEVNRALSEASTMAARIQICADARDC